VRILGLDLSLTATGLATPAGALLTLTCRDRGPKRLAHLEREILVHAHQRGCDLVAIEGYSYASNGSSTYQLGELGGVIRLALWRNGIPFVEVPPACLKKYACGKGNASKDQVLVACVKRLGREPADNNQADAAWLRDMAIDAYSLAMPTVPSSHRGVLAKVAWPVVGEWRPFPPGWRTPG
jgi:Holliday junction resolvasome RuvABC endonuclease subunit